MGKTLEFWNFIQQRETNNRDCHANGNLLIVFQLLPLFKSSFQNTSAWRENKIQRRIIGFRGLGPSWEIFHCFSCGGRCAWVCCCFSHLWCSKFPWPLEPWHEVRIMSVSFPFLLVIGITSFGAFWPSHWPIQSDLLIPDITSKDLHNLISSSDFWCISPVCHDKLCNKFFPNCNFVNQNK